MSIPAQSSYSDNHKPLTNQALHRGYTSQALEKVGIDTCLLQQIVTNLMGKVREGIAASGDSLFASKIVPPGIQHNTHLVKSRCQNYTYYTKPKSLVLGEGDRGAQKAQGRSWDLDRILSENKKGYEKEISSLRKMGMLEKVVAIIRRLVPMLQQITLLNKCIPLLKMLAVHLKTKREARLEKVTLTMYSEDVFITKAMRTKERSIEEHTPRNDLGRPVIYQDQIMSKISKLEAPEMTISREDSFANWLAGKPNPEATKHTIDWVKLTKEEFQSGQIRGYIDCK